jgi:hypothetical protein
MAWTLINSNAVTFADGATGHVYALPSGAPSPGQLDILCVNSNGTVSTPAGWTLGPTFVGGQGAYLFYRVAAGGESSSVTITTSISTPTALSWSRWSAGTITADVQAVAHVDNALGTASPAVTTPALAGSGELSVAFAALHSINGSCPVTPVWSSGYTPMLSACSGTTASDVSAFTGYNSGAGPAAESPGVTWTNQAADRYILVQVFKSVSSMVTGDDDVPWHIRSRR